MRKFTFYIALAILACTATEAFALEQDRHSAVILAYYGIGDEDYSDASLPLEQFLAHVKEIKEEGYNVIGLPALIDAFESGTEIPEKTIAITFQGETSSAFKNAFPVLINEKIPFTIFHSAAHIEDASEDSVRLSDLKDLNKNKDITIGIMPDFDESSLSPERAKRQINNAILKYRQLFNAQPLFLAYPYGEYSNELKDIVRESGFKAALGLQSGAAYAGNDLYALPRFSMSGRYGDLERFRLVTMALPFPVYDVEPADSYIKTSTPIGFSVPESLRQNLSDINCFISGEDSPKVEVIGNRVELRDYNVIAEDRTRINCTLPSGISSDQGPRWRWFGMLLTGPTG